MEIKEFCYKKADGTESDREVIVLSSPRDSYMALDISQFEEDEKDYYVAEYAKIEAEFSQRLEELFKERNAKIKELGLGSCFRQFKKDRILEESE